MVLQTNSTNARISNLVKEHLYSIRVRAATRAGFGPFSNAVDVRATSSGD